ncbi:hypothetical protein SAMN05192569_10398 [Parageobacillus thermantarcticus]|uniref:Uncharacterized protein n=1 Tax=Parageobacillus thermantarcticus TaxID=186116 RepID=A0A1I0TM56_9BACL|nr:hypothetical protein [Parageobacillus thermantarcticus]SFA52890.1 hypothetical protein SAMN05192569_10398 [Parageobacillus thermantarcticus]
MNRLRLFKFGRNRRMWNQLLRLMGRRNNNNAIWTIFSLGLGIAATAIFRMRRSGAQYMMAKPIQRAMRSLNSLMNRQMKMPSLATMEISKEIAETPKTASTNYHPYQQQK